MPAWVEQISANTLGTYGAAVIGVLIAILLIILIFRLLFGRRLRMQGSRQRLARLGLVDAFSVDRQRQLVIIRRDNVEHLILIGGPNDLLIESEIIRAEARDSRDQRLREKETKDIGVVPVLSGTVRTPAAAAVSLSNLPPQPEESFSPLPASAAASRPEAGQAAASSSQLSAASAVPPLVVQPAAPPSFSSRPLPRAIPQGSDLLARAQQAQTTAEPSGGQPGTQTTEPVQPALAAEKQTPSFESAAIPRPASPFTLPPRPNPFPVPPRRAPVTTPLPRTLLAREAAGGAQTESGAENPGMPKAADLGAKTEPTFTSRPSFLRPPLGSPLPSSLARPLPRAGAPQETVPLPLGQQPEPPVPGPNEEGFATVDAEGKLPSVSPNVSKTASTQPPAVSGPVEQVQSEHAATYASGSAETKPAEDGKQLAVVEGADPLNTLEAEMAKLLGRE